MSPAINSYAPQLVLLMLARSMPGTYRLSRTRQVRHLRSQVLVVGNAMPPFLMRTDAATHRHLGP